MEDSAPVNLMKISNNICIECGLPFKIFSYEKQEEGNDSQKIKITLFCQNPEHKKKYEYNFEEYQNLVENNMNTICKCFFCNEIMQNSSLVPHYCYDCKKIICSDCLEKSHDKKHENVVKYEEIQNKCLVHKLNEIKFFCLDCKIGMCDNCITESIEHLQNHCVKEIDKFKKANERNIISLKNEQEEYNKERNILLNKLKILDYKIKFNNLLIKEESNYFYLFEFDNLNNSCINNNVENDQNNQKNDINNVQNNEINEHQLINNNDVQSNISDDKISHISLDNIVLKNNDGQNNNNANSQSANSNSNQSQDNKKNQIDNINNDINNDINNNKIQKIYETPMGNKNNVIQYEEINPINVIYLDDNLKFESHGIIDDCYKIQKQTNCSLILLNDLNNLNLLFQHLLKNNTKSKFIFIVNGGKSEDSVNLIKKNKDYKSLFVGACIYTTTLEKYSKVKQKNSDFVNDICTDVKSVIAFIKKISINSKIDNQKYYINSIINLKTYNDSYSKLHKELSKFYGDESENVFNFFYKLINTYLTEESKEPKKEQILPCFQTFSEIFKKNYEEIIVCYLKDNYYSEFLNKILKTKDFEKYQRISYFVGNLMHSLVQYGEKTKKCVDYAMSFYKGMQLNIVDLMEFLKNRQNIITLEYFLPVSSKIELAEITSKRKVDAKQRKEKQFYSVILKFDYLYDEGYKSSIIDLRDIQPYPNDENYIILPFTFFNLKKLEIDSNQYFANLELEIIGKTEFLESQLKNNDKKILEYDKKNFIMVLK